jgi:hypothetical protein
MNAALDERQWSLCCTDVRVHYSIYKVVIQVAMTSVSLQADAHEDGRQS